MKVIKKVESGGFYLMKGVASANTLFFEDRAEKLKFQELANLYLGCIMEIREYVMVGDGWMLVVKLKTKSTIKKHFDKLKANSPTRGKRFVKIWEKVSEMVRMFLNRYSRWANRKRGRIGNLVGKTYERYYFDSGEELLKKVEEIRESKIEMSQPNRRFRPMKKYYDRKGMMGVESWVRTSKMAQNGKILVKEIGLKCLCLWEMSLSVAQILVEATIKLHTSKKSFKSNPAPS